LLYVALTRARDTLILTGSVTEKKWSGHWTEAGTITTQKILAAKSYADWLGLWFAQQPGASPELKGELPHLRWRFVADAALAREKTEGKNLPAEPQLPEFDEATLQKLRENLSWKYDFRAATERAAKSSVTALRRQAEESDDEAEPVFGLPFPPERTGPNRKLQIANRKLNAADAGTAQHKFLQHVALENVGGLAALEAAAKRLETAKVLSADERAALDLQAVAAFWDSDTGQKIRQQAANVRRELAFTARFSPQELDALTGSSRHSFPAPDEFIVVQGVTDLAVILAEEIWLVDFKTDAVRAGELAAKTKIYEPQLKLYASALAKIYSRPVTHGWLHFLSARKTAEIKLTR
jgi:ATP-dependent helicase/nuclease subunit A